MNRASRLAALLAALALCAGREARAQDAPGPPAAQGLGRLDVALLLHPFTREALYTLETYNARYSPDPGSRVEPGAALGAFEEMLRRRFRTVTRLEREEEAASGRFQLVYHLDLSLEIGLRSGDKTEVHAIAHILRPDGAKVDFISVTATRTVPVPAARNLLLEAVLEARDKTEAALLASRPLAAFAAAPPAAPAAADRALSLESAASEAVGAAGPGGQPPGVEVAWVRLPGGSFLMGSEREGEGPVHRVTLKGFQLSRTEVTFRQYRACVRAGACSAPHAADGTCYQHVGLSWLHGNLPSEFQGEDQPVVCVDWDQARAFAAWAGGRLPSEAEWEYAARGGGKGQDSPWGDAAPTCERSVMFDAAYGCGRKATWPVCSRPAGNTEQGLCDMLGNAFEWVQDSDHPSYSGAPADGSAWEDPDSTTRVRRGGSWATGPAGVRAAYRLRDHPALRFSSLGFRVAR